MTTENLLLQHILHKSKYTNLKEFARGCFDYLRQNTAIIIGVVHRVCM